jgi:hypothetical protein
MKISGHKNEKDFYKYIRVTPEEAAQKIKELWQERNTMSVFNTELKLYPDSNLQKKKSIVMIK